MIVCFSGWRGWSDTQYTKRLVNDVILDMLPTQFRVGDCPTGVDYQIRQELDRRGKPYTQYGADWDSLGKAAGPIRNREMLTGHLQSLADVLVALPEPNIHPGQKVSGTWTCIGQAYELGVDVLIPRYRRGEVSGS